MQLSLRSSVVALLFSFVLAGQPFAAAADATSAPSANPAAVATVQAAEAAGKAAADAGGAIKEQGQQVMARSDQAKLQMREEGLAMDVILSLIVLGAITGTAAGALFTFRVQGFGWFLNAIIGGIGAVIGAFAYKVMQVQLGWPVIRIPLEALALSLVVSLVFVFFWRRMISKKPVKAAKAESAPAKATH